jgi:sugar lactone lactonase YvrE
MNGDPNCVIAAEAMLGEGPVWVGAEQALYWLDSLAPVVFRYTPGDGRNERLSWGVPSPIGCLVPRRGGGFLLGLCDGLYLPALGAEPVKLLDLVVGWPENRLNDGKSDRAGRLWVGSIHAAETAPTGHLYSVGADLSWNRVDSGFICSNGLDWSLDDRILYFADSGTRTIFSYEFDPATGAVGQRRAFASLSGDDGTPDGLAVDQEGYIWCACWDGWQILRFAPDGRIVRRIAMPVQRPTSLAFGGWDYGTLFVTSARIDLSAAELARGPLAGSVFALTPGVAGRAPFEFAG